jgi:hypothetical protein
MGRLLTDVQYVFVLVVDKRDGPKAIPSDYGSLPIPIFVDCQRAVTAAARDEFITGEIRMDSPDGVMEAVERCHT